MTRVMHTSVTLSREKIVVPTVVPTVSVVFIYKHTCYITSSVMGIRSIAQQVLYYDICHLGIDVIYRRFSTGPSKKFIP